MAILYLFVLWSAAAAVAVAAAAAAFGLSWHVLGTKFRWAARKLCSSYRQCRVHQRFLMELEDDGCADTDTAPCVHSV
jgi:hypothetical protein